MTARDIAEFLKRLEKDEIKSSEIRLSEVFPGSTIAASRVLNAAGLQDDGSFPDIKEMATNIQEKLNRSEIIADYVSSNKPASIKADLWFLFDRRQADLTVKTQ